MKKWIPGWVANGWGAVRRGWRRLRGWRPDVRGWPWRVRWLAHRAGERGVGVILVAIAVAMAAGLAVVFIYDPTWLTGTVSGGQPGSESRSTTIRNVGLIGGGAIAILIAYWRSRLAQQDLLNKRYQEGAAMLGNDVLSVRLAGIYALERLAKDHPWEYHIDVMKLLCAFVRHPAQAEDLDHPLDAEVEITPRWRDAEPTYTLREDVQVAMDAIAACHEGQLRLEAADKFRLDLHEADLKGADLQGKDLSSEDWKPPQGASSLSWLVSYPGSNFLGASLREANLRGAKLQHANFFGATLPEAKLESADLSGAVFIDADLSDAMLNGADLTGAMLLQAIVSGARFSVDGDIPVRGLTQAQLDSALSDPNNLPRLDGMVNPRSDPPEPLRPPYRGLDGKPHPNPPPIPDD